MLFFLRENYWLMASVWAARDEWNGLEVIAWNSMLLLDILLFVFFFAQFFSLFFFSLLLSASSTERKNEALSWNDFHFKLPVSKTFFQNCSLLLFSISLFINWFHSFTFFYRMFQVNLKLTNDSIVPRRWEEKWTKYIDGDFVLGLFLLLIDWNFLKLLAFNRPLLKY